MNKIEELIERVWEINRRFSNQGLFVWFIAPYVGGIGRQWIDGDVDWNATDDSLGFHGVEELEVAVEYLEAHYEGREVD